MRYNVLVTVPNDLDTTLVDVNGDYLIGNDIMWELSELSAVWPALVTPGTEPISPYKLIHGVITTDSEDVKTYIESLIISYSLDWILRGILTHDDIEEVVNGEEITYQNKIIMPIDTVEVFKYILDREGKVKDISWLHTRQYRHFKWRV